MKLIWVAMLLAAATNSFTGRVNEYVKLHNRVRGEVHNLKPGAQADAIEQFERRFAEGLLKAREGAVQGNIFSTEIAAEFRRVLALAVQGDDARRVRESLQHASPARALAIRVNQTYPPSAPLQSMPPTLLKALPPLPKEVEYRLMGRTLVLRDAEANIVVDYLPEAVK